RARQPPPPLRLDPVAETEEAPAAGHPAAEPTEPAVDGEPGESHAAAAPEASEGNAGNDSPDGEGESATQQRDDSDPHVRVVSGTLGTGGTFYDVLASLGVGPAQIRDVTEALRGSVDFRASQAPPEHRPAVRRNLRVAREFLHGPAPRRYLPRRRRRRNRRRSVRPLRDRPGDRVSRRARRRAARVLLRGPRRVRRLLRRSR